MRILAVVAIAFALIISFATAINANAEVGALDLKGNEIKLVNPLGKDATVMTVLAKIFDTMMIVMLVVVPIFIVIGAFQMMFAAGNPEKFATGQKTILYSVIGLVIILMAKGIVAIVTSILKV